MMERAGSALEPGYRLDRYELLCPIATGGMAAVWLARMQGKRGFEKLFAIKTIKTELLHDARFQEMLLDEARIASGIHHPNVAQIIDLGEQDDILYIVMEWIDGESLAKIRRLAPKRRTLLPLGFSLRVIADACEGLHAAHELHDLRGKSVGLVHRDVSPQNILISAAGSVKVIDFGIAKATNRSAGETRDGIIKGKVHYMAPEQVGGHAIDRRVDIWSVGVCLYELVIGKLPFDGETDVDIVRRLLLGNEPAPRLDPSVPGPIAEIITCSLARDRGARYATARAMQRAIETAIDKLGVAAKNEDVAEFLHAHFADLREQRRAMIERAIESAQTRTAQAASSGRQTSVRSDDNATSPKAIGIVRRTRPSTAQPSASPTKEDSKLTLGSAALEMEERVRPPKRRGWLWVALLAGTLAGGWRYGWRAHGLERVRAWLAPVARLTPQEVVPAAPPVPVRASPARSEEPEVAVAAASVASAGSTAPQQASASIPALRAQRPRGSPLTSRSGAAAIAPAANVARPSAVTTAEAPSLVTPPPVEDDKDNPYK